MTCDYPDIFDKLRIQLLSYNPPAITRFEVVFKVMIDLHMAFPTDNDLVPCLHRLFSEPAELYKKRPQKKLFDQYFKVNVGRSGIKIALRAEAAKDGFSPDL